MSTFGTRLKKLRKERKLSQQELANRIGINRSTYARYETDDNQADYETLQNLADFFDVSVDYLLGRTDDPTTLGKVKEDPFSDLPEDINMFFKDYEKLNDEDKRLIAKQVKALLKMAEEENKEK